MTKISDVLDVSEEVLERHVKGTIELYKVTGEDDAFEKDSKAVLSSTYPTTTIRKIIDFISRKMDPKQKSDIRGSFAITGTYGTGKSHILTALYHIFNDPTMAKKWLEDNSMSPDLLPTFPQTVVMPMLNLKKRYKFLWEPIYEELGKEDLLKEIGDFPTVDDIKSLVGTGTVVLLIDEIEKWYGAIPSEDAPRRTANLAFLQNLMEVANEKSVKLFLFVSLLLENEEIMGIMSRTRPIKFDLTSEDIDRINIILHRLIGKIKDREAIEMIAKQYVGLYKRSEDISTPNYRELQDKIIEQYPFHPEVLKVIIERFHASKNYQNTRGILSILAEILYGKKDEVDLILMSDVDVELKLENPHYEIKDDLVWIDDKLVENCLNDIQRLRGQKYAKETLNTILMYSLTKMGRAGANKTGLLMGVIRPGISSNDVMMNFTGQIYRRAWYLHKLNGEYAIMEEPNPYAVLEAGAESVSRNEAIQRMERMLIEDIFKGPDVYIWDSISGQTQIPDTRNFRIAISLDGSDISFERFKPNLAGTTYQNTLVIVVPKKGATVKGTGLIEMAKRLCAGEKIASEEKDLPDGFSEIVLDEKKNLMERLQEKYGRVLKFVGDATFPKNISKATREDVINAVKPDVDNVKSTILQIAQNAGEKGIRIDLLQDDFYVKRENPTITDPGIITTALKELCKDKEIKLTSQSGVDYFGDRNVTIADSMFVYHKDFVKEPPPSGPTIWVPPGGGEIEEGKEPGPAPPPPVEPVKTVSIPPMGAISATAKPELIDKIDREINAEDVLKEVDLSISGGLESDDLDNLGLPKIKVIETGSTHSIRLILKTEMDKRELVAFLRGLKTPKRATFEIQMEVVRG